MSERSDIPGADGGAATQPAQAHASPEHLRWEQERELTIEFFRLVNASDSIYGLIDAAVNFFQQHSQCEAIAVRLRRGCDFPYFHARGFSEEFLRCENKLCSRDCFGEVTRDGSNGANLECRCGDIISGCFDPAKPFFTPSGSFWTNSVNDTRLSYQPRIRHSGCSNQGYQSIALIALNVGKDRIGLLQLDDKRTGRFTREDILFWESLANHLAVALARFLAEGQIKALEEQFRHAQKMEAVGQLAGGIAHDFNNLLMVIRSYTEILEESLPPQDAARGKTQAILNATDRAASLTRQMLAFSRKQVLSPLPLNLNDSITESAKMLQRIIGEDVELRVQPAASLWTVRADPDQIAQVLMNLSVNSRDAMPTGGTLTLETRNVTVGNSLIERYPFMAPGDYAVLSVTDTGTGIPKDVQERMFEPFFTTKGVGRGTGLGLSTVYGIVKQSGGYLLCDSEPGRGAAFSIYLPRIHDEFSHAERSKAFRLLQGTETLLLVEDEDALRESMRQYLTGLGYTVLAAGSGQQALAIANQFQQPIHLMISDVVMPRVSGRELSQILESIRPEMKTVFMSGYIGDAIERHGVQTEGAAFLQKPFSLETLARKLRELLG